ncbi:MAG: hypothetical protein ABSA31_06490 [Acidimicrobiales bacterium]|jgi:hypothetical protein
MNGIATLFEQLPLPEVARIVRRTVWAGIAVGVVALGVSALLGHVLVGFGGCVGLALGLANIRLISRSAARLSAESGSHRKRSIASGTLARLGITTVIVVGLVIASIQLGLGTACGIAVFYFIYIASLIRSLLQQSRTGMAS